jgi:dolichyl-diphosphooligosaccharide--protein glycosyltransferase
MFKIHPRLIIGILIAIFFGVSLYLRIFLPYDQIFSGDWIKFSSNDAYYQMRLVDNLVHNFPKLTHFDPFFIYPGGAEVGGVHFFHWLLASIIWITGLGSPTQHTIDIVGVYFPAILGALTVVPVYFIGKALFHRWAGVLAAALIAILPGEFLGRSILGLADYHIAETFFSTVAILFLILAIKDAEQRQLAFSRLRHPDWKASVRPLVYSLLAGIFLGIYLTTWPGGLLFVFIITIYFIIQFIIEHLRHKATDQLGMVGFTLFLAALIIFLPFSPTSDLSVAIVVALLIPPVLSGVSRLLSGRGIKPLYYPLTLIVIGIVFLAIFYAIAPDILGVMWGKFTGVFSPVGATATTTIEMQSFFTETPTAYGTGNTSTGIAWATFNTGFYFGLLSLLIILAYFVMKRGAASKGLLLLFIWSIVILIATSVQRRFAYYLAVNMALLTSYWSVLAYYFLRCLIDGLRNKKTDYMSWEILGLANFDEMLTQPALPQTGSERKKDKREKRQEARSRPTSVQVSIGIWLILAVFLLFFFPDIGLLGRVLGSDGSSDISFGKAWWRTSLAGAAVNTASQARYAPSDAWQEALLWMKENTPEPLGDPNAYYDLYETGYQYPESAYGVTSWWDYGYWVSRTAHRLPSTNPSQAPEPIKKVARLFLSQEESPSYEIMAELDSSYIMIDLDICISKFWAVATWAGNEPSEFIDTYLLPYEGKLVQVQLFLPEYYRSLVVRLYNFDGQAVTPEKSLVVTYDEKVDLDGNRYKQITDAKQFSSYQEALDYVAGQKSGNYSIIGTNPFASPVPLEALQNYKLIYSSKSEVARPDKVMIPEVKVFEYTGG